VHGFLLEVADKAVAETRANHVSHDESIHENALRREWRMDRMTGVNKIIWKFQKTICDQPTRSC
jgi:hypothetical protein